MTDTAESLDPLRLPLIGERLIEASAGTGKTFTIAALYLRLLLGLGGEAAYPRAISVEELLVVTFTEAATEELRGRIRSNIHELRIACLRGESDNPLYSALLAEIADKDDAAKTLLLAERQMDEAAVFTIHGFCQRMLSLNAFESGMLFEQQLIEDESRLRYQACADFWRRHCYPLTRDIAAVIHDVWKGPRDLLKSLDRWLQGEAPQLKSPPAPNETLAERHQQIIARIDSLKQQWREQVGEIEGVLENSGLDRRKFNRGNQGKWMEKVNAWAQEETLSYQLPDALEKFAQSFLLERTKAGGEPPVHPLFSAVESLLASSLTLTDLVLARAMVEIRDAVAREKRRRGELGFDDMLSRLDEALRGDSGETLASAIRQRFPVAMIDEFQDINRVQYEIVRMLAAPRNNLFIVGDDDQSIYRFRGAKPEIMLGFEKDYPRAKQTLLGINYRSTSNIVDDAGKLIRHNKTRFDKEIRAARGAGKPVTTSGFADAQTETRMIVKEIQDYVRMGYSYSDIAVLYRTNMEPRLLMERLMEYNIPFQMRDALPNIYEHWITQDLLTYIRMAADPLAEKHQAKRADALRIINRPKRYISREALDGQIISWDSVKSWYKAKNWMVERIEDLEYDLKILKKLAPVAAVNYIRKAIGYDEYLKDYAQYRRMKPEELFELADQIQESASGYKTMDAWLLHMEEYGEQLKQQAQNRGERDLDCVALMTMHSSKGLEFPIVYLMDANERVTPHHKAVLEADLEEERRMFYVAMTRAKDRLHVYYTKERYGKPQERSRFIDEYLYPDGAPPGEFRPGPQQNGAAGSYNRKAVR